MSNQPKDKGTSPNIEQLLKEGISAAKSNDKALARSKLREVVALDQYNEKGWFWLASVVETDEERRVCLGNVVVINPDNTKARQLLDSLNDLNSRDSKAKRASQSATDWMNMSGKPEKQPASRSKLLLLVVVGVALVAVLFLLTRGGGDAQPSSVSSASPAAGTVEASPDTSTETAVFELTAQSLQKTNTQVAILQTQTAIPKQSATAAQVTLASRLTLPPSWTPRLTPTLRGTLTATPLASPPPQALTGKLVTSHGKINTEDGYVPLFILDLERNQERLATGADRGGWGILSPNGTQLIYARFSSSGRPQTLLRIVTLNGLVQPEELSAIWGSTPALADQQMVALSKSGKQLAFSARSVIGENENTWGIYLLPVKFALPGPTATPTATATDTPTLKPTNTPLPNVTAPATEAATRTPTPSVTATPSPVPVPVKRLTKINEGYNLWPDFSPDEQFILYSREERTLDGKQIASADLFIISVKGGAPRNLTNDGADNLESMPRFSPNGKSIVYTVTRPGNTNRELYIMNADGSNRRPLEQESKGDNQRPLWSPDGKFIAFTSNRSGKNEIFIMQADNGQLFQLTSSLDPISAMDWAR